MAIVVAHASESVDRRDPAARQGGDVEAVAGVVLEVVEVDQGGLAEVREGELHVADLRGDHRLGARRQRRVAHCDRPRSSRSCALLVVGEGVATQVQGLDQVGLFDHLLPVQVEVRIVEEQGSLRAGCARSPQTW